MKKPHDDNYSRRERRLLAVAASMMQAYAGAFSALVYNEIAASPASPELLISFVLYVGQLRLTWSYYRSRLEKDVTGRKVDHGDAVGNRLLSVKGQIMA